jgi:hypothetical protein
MKLIALALRVLSCWTKLLCTGSLITVTELTPWSRVLLEKPIVTEPLEKFAVFHGT